MRSKLVLFTCAALLARGADKEFTLTSLNPPGTADEKWYLGIGYTLPAPTSSQTDKKRWKVFLEPAAGGPSEKVELGEVTVHPGTQQVRLFLKKDKLPTGLSRDTHKWLVIYHPEKGLPQTFLYPPKDSAPKKGFYKGIEKKDDADLYLNGSFLAGVGTSPIYMGDFKFNYLVPLRVRKGVWVTGPTSSMTVNADVKPPQDRTRLDPDSLKAAWTFRHIVKLKRRGLYGLITELNPGGEFARTDVIGNVVGSWLTRFVLTPNTNKPGTAFFAFEPAIGFDAGKTVVKPDTLDKEALDWSRHGSIARGVLGANASWGVLSTDKDTGSRFVLDASYRARIPFTAEPFARTIDRVKQVGFSTRTRHWVQVDLTVPVTPNIGSLGGLRFALTAGFKHGAMAPLFRLVDRQVTFGISISGQQTNKPSL